MRCNIHDVARALSPWRHAALAMLLLVGLAIGCNRSSQAGGPPPFAAPLVTVAGATSANVPVYLDEIGKATALESVTITPQVAGKIIRRDFEDGAELKKDQPLFTIDPKPYQAALNWSTAQLAQAKAAAEFARIELKRYTSVSNPRAISQSDLDAKKNAVDLAVAQQDTAQAAVESARLNLDYCQIRSPINGRAGARLIDVGNVVKANEGSLLVIENWNPIYADFTITEQNLPEVKQQMKNGVLKALVRIPSDPPGGREGKLTFLDNAVQDGSGTVKLRATVDNADQHFWPGQYVNVRLILRTLKGAVLVPTSATQISQQGPFVYVLKANDVAEQRMVTLGQRQGDKVVILKGVAAGERVVTSGQGQVKPDTAVRIDTTPPAAQTQAVAQTAQ